MGVFEVTRGTEVYEIEAPDEATALKAFGQMISGAPAALAKEAPSIPMDMAKSAGSGLARGAAALPGLPADIGGLAQSGMDWLRSKMPGAPSLEEVQAQSRANAIISPETLANFGGQSMVKRLEDNVTGPLYKPQTTPGKFAHTVGEFLPGAIAAPGGVVGNALKFGVAPGLASEAAGQVTGDNPWAKGLAALGTGGAAAFLTRRPGAHAAISNNTQGITAAELGAAEKLMQEGLALPSPVKLTWGEALEKVAPGKGKALLNLQNTVEGRGQLSEMMANRPGAIQESAGHVFDTNISPVAPNPTMVGPQVSQASREIVSDAHKARAAQTKPLYDAAKAEKVPTPEIEAIIAKIDAAIAADKTGLSHPPLKDMRAALIESPATPATAATRTPVMGPNGKVIRYDTTPAVPAKPEVPITDVGNLDRTRKFFRDQTELPAFSPKAIDKETGGRIGGLTSELDNAMESSSAAFAQAKALHQKITEQTINPLMAGPIGKLAKKDRTTDVAIRALFPPHPAANAAEIGTAVSQLAAKNPTVAGQLVRAHTEKALNLAMSRAPDTMAKSLVKNLRGDPQQAENFIAAITALRGPKAAEGVNRFLDIVEAAGNRLPAGSHTAFKTEGINELKGGGTLVTAAKAVLGAGVKLPKMVADKFDRWNLGRNATELARLISDPAAAKVFRNLANAPTTGNKAIMYAAQLTALTTRASQPSPKAGY